MLVCDYCPVGIGLTVPEEKLKNVYYIKCLYFAGSSKFKLNLKQGLLSYFMLTVKIILVPSFWCCKSLSELKRDYKCVLLVMKLLIEYYY